MMKKDEKETYRGDVESYEGSIPLWLVIICVLLLIWGGWYLVAYWDWVGFPGGQ
jgi:hypothetical protein